MRQSQSQYEATAHTSCPRPDSSMSASMFQQEQDQSRVNRAPSHLSASSKPTSEAEDSDAIDIDMLPVHPIELMQAAFEESIMESADPIARKLTERLDAEARRRQLLDNTDVDSTRSLESRWRQRSSAKFHPLWKLVAQISFGVHLLRTKLAKSNVEVVEILQRHVDEVDGFVEDTTADFDLAISDIDERVQYMSLPFEHNRTFNKMLCDRSFRHAILEGNEIIARVIGKTTQAMTAALDDVSRGLDAVSELATFLDGIASVMNTDQQTLDIFIAMRGNAEGWHRCFKDLQAKAGRLRGLMSRLESIVDEVAKRAGIASRRKTPNGVVGRKRASQKPFADICPDVPIAVAPQPSRPRIMNKPLPPEPPIADLPRRSRSSMQPAPFNDGLDNRSTRHQNSTRTEAAHEVRRSELRMSRSLNTPVRPPLNVTFADDVKSPGPSTPSVTRRTRSTKSAVNPRELAVALKSTAYTTPDPPINSAPILPELKRSISADTLNTDAPSDGSQSPRTEVAMVLKGLGYDSATSLLFQNAPPRWSANAPEVIESDVNYYGIPSTTLVDVEEEEILIVLGLDASMHVQEESHFRELGTADRSKSADHQAGITLDETNTAAGAADTLVSGSSLPPQIPDIVVHHELGVDHMFSGMEPLLEGRSSTDSVSTMASDLVQDPSISSINMNALGGLFELEGSPAVEPTDEDINGGFDTDLPKPRSMSSHSLADLGPNIPSSIPIGTVVSATAPIQQVSVEGISELPPSPTSQAGSDHLSSVVPSPELTFPSLNGLVNVDMLLGNPSPPLVETIAPSLILDPQHSMMTCWHSETSGSTASLAFYTDPTTPPARYENKAAVDTIVEPLTSSDLQPEKMNEVNKTGDTTQHNFSASTDSAYASCPDTPRPIDDHRALSIVKEVNSSIGSPQTSPYFSKIDFISITPSTSPGLTDSSLPSSIAPPTLRTPPPHQHLGLPDTSFLLGSSESVGDPEVSATLFRHRRDRSSISITALPRVEYLAPMLKEYGEEVVDFEPETVYEPRKRSMMKRPSLACMRGIFGAKKSPKKGMRGMEANGLGGCVVIT